MNWKLLLKLSFFGLFMAIGTVFFITPIIELFCWLAIFIFCSYFIAKQTNGKYFQQGFVLSLINCVFVTSAHVLFYSTYIAHHPNEAAMSSQMPLPTHPRVMMLIMGPVFGIVFGLVQGLFAFVWSKILKK